MNPEQNPQPLQPLNNQQSAPPSNPVSPAPPTTPTPMPSPYQYQPTKRPNKLLPIIVGGIVILLGIAVGAYALLGGQTEDSPRSSDEQSGTTQNEARENTSSQRGTEPTSNQLQRDLQQKMAASRLLAAAGEYVANNNGKVPPISVMDDAFIDKYLDGAFEDPNGNAYKIVENDPARGEVQYKTGSTCGPDNSIVDGNSRSLVARVLLSDGSFHCSSH